MKNKEDIVGVALIKEVCPLCGKHVDGPIIMNQILSESKAKQVNEMNGQTIGYKDGPCDECAELMKQGILLIGVVEAKTDDPKNPYRSGNQWVVKPNFVERTFGEMAAAVINRGASFISVEAAHQMGFPDCNINA